MNKTCIFCNGRVDSKEDIWPKWVLRLLKKSHAERVPMRAQRYKEQPKEWPTKDSALKIGNVCQECNNGWMSDIDDGAKEPFSALFKINSDTISARDAMAIKSWLFLKFCLHLHISPGHPLRAEDRNTFRIAVDCFLKDFYSTKSMPVDFHLYLGRAPATGKCHTG